MEAPPAWLIAARAAPSQYNAQPWQFQVHADGTLAVRWHPERALQDADPTARHLYLSLGAAIENILLASAAEGTPRVVVPAPVNAEQTVAHLRLASGPVAPADYFLAKAIPHRRTGRQPHLAIPVPQNIVQAMHHEASSRNCQLFVVAEQEKLARIADLTRRAIARSVAQTNLHTVIWEWLRFDPSDPAYFRDGLTAEALQLQGVRLWLARMMKYSEVARFTLRHVYSRDTASLIRQSTMLGLLTISAENRETLIMAGRVLQRIWLIATLARLTLHPILAATDQPEPANYVRVLFGALGRVGVLVFRIGATPPAPPAPRLPLEELLFVENAD